MFILTHNRSSLDFNLSGKLPTKQTVGNKPFIQRSIFRRPLQATVHPMLRDRCPVCRSVLSVCNIGVLWPNGWMDQDATWYEDRPRPRPHCFRWGPSSPRKTAQHSRPTLFSPWLLWPNCGMDHNTTWYGSSLGPGDIVYMGTQLPHGKGHNSPRFSAMSIAAKRSPISATAELLFRSLQKIFAEL